MRPGWVTKKKHPAICKQIKTNPPKLQTLNLESRQKNDRQDKRPGVLPPVSEPSESLEKDVTLRTSRAPNPQALEKSS